MPTVIIERIPTELVRLSSPVTECSGARPGRDYELVLEPGGDLASTGSQLGDWIWENL